MFVRIHIQRSLAGAVPFNSGYRDLKLRISKGLINLVNHHLHPRRDCWRKGFGVLNPGIDPQAALSVGELAAAESQNLQASVLPTDVPQGV